MCRNLAVSLVEEAFGKAAAFGAIFGRRTPSVGFVAAILDGEALSDLDDVSQLSTFVFGVICDQEFGGFFGELVVKSVEERFAGEPLDEGFAACGLYDLGDVKPARSLRSVPRFT